LVYKRLTSVMALQWAKGNCIYTYVYVCIGLTLAPCQKHTREREETKMSLVTNCNVDDFFFFLLSFICRAFLVMKVKEITAVDRRQPVSKFQHIQKHKKVKSPIVVLL
jgi:hypothetical protein